MHPKYPIVPEQITDIILMRLVLRAFKGVILINHLKYLIKITIIKKL